jgi:NAD(P)H-nitrite reductase large subunit
MTEDTSFTIDNINMSLVTQEEMQQINSLLQKYKVKLTRITPGQKLVLFGLAQESFQPLLQELDAIIVPLKSGSQNTVARLTSIRCCPDPDQCKYSIVSSKKLGRMLNRLSFSKPFPNKVKIAISACSMCCTEPLVRDIGIVATRKGWKIYFGGNGGGKPRIADLIAANLNEKEVVTFVERILDFYSENAAPKQRTARFVESFGIDPIKRNILK